MSDYTGPTKAVLTFRDDRTGILLAHIRRLRSARRRPVVRPF